jgi:hypothetical protein
MAPGILRRHDHVEEVALLVRPDARERQVLLDGIGIEEMLRRLHHAHVRLAHERQGAGQPLALGHEVGIEDGDEIGALRQCRDMAQSIVDVARLGVLVIAARDVATTLPLAEFLEPLAAAVVADPQSIVRIVDPERTDNRAIEDHLVLVVGADEYVDEGRFGKGFEPGHIAVGFGRPVPRAREEKERKRHADHGQEFDRGEEDAEGEVQRQSNRW